LHRAGAGVDHDVQIRSTFENRTLGHVFDDDSVARARGSAAAAPAFIDRAEMVQESLIETLVSDDSQQARLGFDQLDVAFVSACDLRRGPKDFLKQRLEPFRPRQACGDVL